MRSVRGLVRRFYDRARARPLELLAWLTPLVIAEIIRHSYLVSLKTLVAVAIAALLVPALSRRPGPVLVALVWFLSLQYLGLSWLYHLGAPRGVVKQLSLLKELLGLSLIVAAGRELLARRSRLDVIDKAILAYTAAVTVYLVAPMLVSESFYPKSLTIRLLGWRLNVAFLLLFVAARHAPIPPVWRRRFISSVIALGVAAAGFGIYEWISPAGWRQIVINDFGVVPYEFYVNGKSLAEIIRQLAWSTYHPTRTASAFNSPFTYADYLLISSGLVFERLARDRRLSKGLVIAGVLALGLFAAETRSDLLAFVLMAFLVALPSRGRRHWNRLRIAALLALVVLLFLPTLGSTRLGGANNSAGSNQGHIEEIQAGIELVSRYPLGAGLGSAPAVATRDPSLPLFITDNSILQVGGELGAAMMVFFVALLVLALVGLSRAVRDGPPDELASGARLALIGLLFAGQLHHVFQFFGVAWIVWAAAGLGMADTRLHRLRRPRPTLARPMPVTERVLVH